MHQMLNAPAVDGWTPAVHHVGPHESVLLLLPSLLSAARRVQCPSAAGTSAACSNGVRAAAVQQARENSCAAQITHLLAGLTGTRAVPLGSCLHLQGQTALSPMAYQQSQEYSLPKTHLCMLDGGRPCLVEGAVSCIILNCLPRWQRLLVAGFWIAESWQAKFRAIGTAC